MPIKFADLSTEQMQDVQRIVDRALPLLRKAGAKVTPLDLMMAISCVHAQMPLHLRNLAAADDFQFAHDVAGIYRHLNRRTGELENCFVPRFALPKDAVYV